MRLNLNSDSNFDFEKNMSHQESVECSFKQLEQEKLFKTKLRLKAMKKKTTSMTTFCCLHCLVWGCAIGYSWDFALTNFDLLEKLKRDHLVT